MDGFVLALTANFLFSFSSLYIAKYTVVFGSVWTNFFKNTIALICFTAGAFYLGAELFPSGSVQIYLIASGIIGLAIGDIFILKAFAKLGSTRVIVLFGLTPFFVAICRYLAFKQTLLLSEIVPVIFFSSCLILFARERKKLIGHWDFKSLLIGTFGVFLDAVGVVLTRMAFEDMPELTTFHANTIRTLGSLPVLYLFLKINKLSVIEPIRQTQKNKRALLFLVPMTGTFLSLLCYLQAIKVGNLVIVTALGVSGPILSSLLESYLDRKKPSKYLILAIIMFILGVLAKIYFMHRFI